MYISNAKCAHPAGLQHAQPTAGDVGPELPAHSTGGHSPPCGRTYRANGSQAASRRLPEVSFNGYLRVQA